VDELLDAVLGRAAVAGGLAVTGTAVAGAVLVPLHLWRPAVVLPVVLVVLALAVRAVADLPAPRWPRPAALATLALVVGDVIWTAATHAEHVVVRRDGGSYAQYTQWIATRGGLPIDVDLPAFGGAAALQVPGFGFDVPAFYQVATGLAGESAVTVVPQFLVGTPAVLSLGWWTGGLAGSPWGGVQVMPALLLGAALLGFAALARRAVGAAWTPVAVALLALCEPVVHAGRTTLSEPAALVMLMTAAVLVGHRRWLLGGWVLGLVGLVRVDALREVTVVVAVAAVLALRRHPGAVRLAGGALAGAGVSAVVWQLMARPYLRTVSGSLTPLLAATVAVCVLAFVAVPLLRNRIRPVVGARRDRTDRVVVALVAGLGLGLASRPWWQTVRQDPNDPGAQFVATLQAGQQLTVDGGRTYAEHSLDWVAWWLGRPAVALSWAAIVGLVVVAVRWWRRSADDPGPWWLVPAAVGLASTVLVLQRPGITPDHPWADRRLVTTVLPFVVLTAVLALAQGVTWLHRRGSGQVGTGSGLFGTGSALFGVGHGRAAASLAVALGVAALAVPVGIGTWPFLTTRTEAGEPAAVAQVCATLADGDVVVAVEGTDDGHAQRSINEWVQVVRGGCDRPAAALRTPAVSRAAAVAQLAELAAHAGHRLVLLTAQESDAAAEQVLRDACAAVPTAGAPRRAVRLETIEDAQRLTRPPRANARLVVDVWTQPVPVAG
jgi:hypothetical protein